MARSECVLDEYNDWHIMASTLNLEMSFWAACDYDIYIANCIEQHISFKAALCCTRLGSSF